MIEAVAADNKKSLRKAPRLAIMKNAHQLLLTFDIEDFINPNAMYALSSILELLKKYRLRALFFITGHMAERLSQFPKILDLLKDHEIGYHSSAHSVRPTIPEYADTKSYQQALSISLERETTHINPMTGRMEGKGGIYFLQDLFYPQKIVAFRAPGMSWTPPHLEALVTLGIRFDFSSYVTVSEPVNYSKITFYPYTFMQQWNGTRFDYLCFLSAIFRRKVAVFDLHPTLYVNQFMWDSIYYKGNPKMLTEVPRRPSKETRSLLRGFELLLKQIDLLRHARLLQTDPKSWISYRKLITSRSHVQEYFEMSAAWPRKFFNYTPRHIRDHFLDFFENACE